MTDILFPYVSWSISWLSILSFPFSSVKLLSRVLICHIAHPPSISLLEVFSFCCLHNKVNFTVILLTFLKKPSWCFLGILSQYFDRIELFYLRTRCVCVYLIYYDSLRSFKVFHVVLHFLFTFFEAVINRI